MVADRGTKRAAVISLGCGRSPRQEPAPRRSRPRPASPGRFPFPPDPDCPPRHPDGSRSAQLARAPAIAAAWASDPMLKRLSMR